MTAIVSMFTSLPFTQLRRNRYFYFYYDGFYALLFVGIIAALKTTGYVGLIHEWHWSYLAVFPLVSYLGILCNVFVHVCTHNSLPRPWNRLVGELCGLVVLTRFASWEVLHQRHHRYSDDVEKDPHPLDPSYLRFCWHHISGLEPQLHAAVFDLYGNTPENQRIEKIRSVVSFFTGVLLVATWYTVLGKYAFFGFFLPSIIIGFFQLVHFNWSTHNAFSPIHDWKPVNLNHGLYKLGNKLFFGIYMHANHHKKANVLNPATIEPSLPLTPPPTKEEIAAGPALLAEKLATEKAA